MSISIARSRTASSLGSACEGSAVAPRKVAATATRPQVDRVTPAPGRVVHRPSPSLFRASPAPSPAAPPPPPRGQRPPPPPPPPPPPAPPPPPKPDPTPEPLVPATVVANEPTEVASVLKDGVAPGYAPMYQPVYTCARPWACNSSNTLAHRSATPKMMAKGKYRENTSMLSSNRIWLASAVVRYVRKPRICSYSARPTALRRSEVEKDAIRMINQPPTTPNAIRSNVTAEGGSRSSTAPSNAASSSAAARPICHTRDRPRGVMPSSRRASASSGRVNSPWASTCLVTFLPSSVLAFCIFLVEDFNCITGPSSNRAVSNWSS